MKKSFLLIAFFCFLSLKSFEYVEKSPSTSVTSFLSKYLEPADPLTESTLDLPFQIWCNQSELKKVFLSPNEIQTMIYSFNFINLCITLFNAWLYPGTFLEPLNKTNINITSQTTFNACNYILDSSIAFELCKVVAGLAIPLIAHYNNPELFVRHTYLKVYELGSSLPFLSDIHLPYLGSPFPYLYLACKKKYANFKNIVKPIEDIFEAKQIMLFILTVLACCKIKLKNSTFLTNPTYCPFYWYFTCTVQ